LKKHFITNRQYSEQIQRRRRGREAGELVEKWFYVRPTCQRPRQNSLTWDPLLAISVE